MRRRIRARLLLLALLVLLLTVAAGRHPTPAPQCTWTPDPGPCRAFFRRYYYNNITHACEVFVHGGCDGTVPFRTSQQCQAAHCGELVDKQRLGLPPYLSLALSRDPRLRVIRLNASVVIV